MFGDIYPFIHTYTLSSRSIKKPNKVTVEQHAQTYSYKNRRKVHHNKKHQIIINNINNNNCKLKVITAREQKFNFTRLYVDICSLPASSSSEKNCAAVDRLLSPAMVLFIKIYNRITNIVKAMSNGNKNMAWSTMR